LFFVFVSHSFLGMDRGYPQAAGLQNTSKDYYNNASHTVTPSHSHSTLDTQHCHGLHDEVKLY
jgi:hypothetical protein